MRYLPAILLLLLPLHVAESQFYYFGRNKVQWTDFDWRVLQTEHFDIYYYTEMRELAERGAKHAEETYDRLSQQFNHTVLNRIPLVFYSSHLHFQQTNITPGFIPEGVGGFFEFLKGRVVIPSQGSTEEFFHVIRHELVHVFMNSKVLKTLSNHRQPLDRYPPLWFTEGLAEHWFTEWDTQADMVLRDAVLNNYIVPLSEMDRINGTFLMYKEGQAILEYISATYGKESILLLMENFWKANSFSEVMKLTIGKTYKEFDEEWLYFLKKKYYPKLAAEDLPKNASADVISIGFNSKPVFFKHDGKRWAYFLGNHTGYSSIYRIDLDSKDKEPNPELILEGEQSSVFEAFNLYHTRLDISRDTVLAFVTKSGESDALHLYDLHARELKRSFRFSTIVDIGAISWAPDGKRLAFTGVNIGGNSDLYIVNTETEELRRLTDDFYDDRSPAWSPDGRTIVFSSDRTPFGAHGKYNLFAYDVDSGDISYLTLGNETYVSPAWSPDGERIAFVSDRGGVQNIWVMKYVPRSGTFPPSPEMRRVTSFATAAFDPAWTDNDELLFTAFEKFSFRIAKADSIARAYDTSSATVVFAFNKREPVWEPSRLSGTSIVKEFKYKGKYQLDIAQSMIATDPIFGTSGGAAVALSDVLGNDQFYFLLYNTAQTRGDFLESFNIAISRTNLGKRANYAYGIFRLAGNRYDLRDPDLYYYERTFGGYFALSYPLSTFERIETGVTLANSLKDDYFGFEPRKAFLVSNSVAFVSDNSLWGPSGPLDGHRFKFQLAYTSDAQYSNVNYWSLIADGRKYIRLSERSALATRAHLWYNDGIEARRFIMGGSWDLRGWGRWTLRGQKAWLTSVELRYPFIDALGIRFPFGGIGFGSIRGAIFADAGGVWDEIYRDTKGSLGIGWRFNIGGVIVLRYDIGKRIEQNFSRLQQGLFYQFFFGWDF